MIKMDYGDANKKKVLIQEYPKIFKSKTLAEKEKEWTRLRKKLTGSKIGLADNLLPITFKDILVADFDVLFNIYQAYKSVFTPSKLKQKTYKKIHRELKVLFNYSDISDTQNGKPHKIGGKQDSIARFFMNNFDNLHTCYYCETAYINAFKSEKRLKSGQKKEVRHFDIDHVLNKAACPIVALSLFNFVPSCPICNERLKRDDDLSGGDLAIARKLSPTTDFYDFESSVDIRLALKQGKSLGGLAVKHPDDLRLRFVTNDADYQKEIDTFYLEERYNYHIGYALRLWDNKSKYNTSQCAEIAKLFADAGLKTDAAEVREDIFGTHFMHDYHRTFEKMHNDIMKQDKLDTLK